MIIKEDILNLEKRQNLYKFILKNPGLHLRELSRRLKIPITTLKYHLRFLKKFDLIEERYTGQCKQIYISGKMSKEDKQLLALFKEKIPCRIFIYLLFRFTFSRKELSKELEESPARISYHIKKMLDMEIIEKATVENGFIRPYPDPNNRVISKREPVGREIFYRRKKNKKIITRIYRVLVTNRDNIYDKELINTYIDYLKKLHELGFSGKKLKKLANKKVIQNKGIKNTFAVIPNMNSLFDFVSEIIKPPFAT